MPNLDESNVASFLERFSRCYDGVILSININMQPGNRKFVTNVTLSLPHDNLTMSKERITLSLKMWHVFEYRIQEEANLTYQVLSDGMTITFLDNAIYLDFASEIENPTRIEEIRQSKVYIGAKGCSWDVIPYSIW